MSQIKTEYPKIFGLPRADQLPFPVANLDRTLRALARGGFTIVLLAALSSPQAVEADGRWWNDRYQERLPLRISNSDQSPLPGGYTIAVAFNHLALVAQGRSRADGLDIRLVRESGDHFREVNRVLSDDSNWALDQTTILFQTEREIDQADESYFIYFNNPEADSPPADLHRVYPLYQDFETLPLGLQPPAWDKFGTDLELKVEVSDEQAASGEQSLKLSGNGWAKSAYRLSPVGQNYTASVRFLTLDQSHEGGLYFRSDLSNQFHPTWIYQSGGWWYAGGDRNLRIESGLPLPESGQWSTLEVKVVDSEIVFLKVDGRPGLTQLATAWQGEYLGVSFRATKLVYYDDFWVKKAVRAEPVVELKPVELRPQPYLEVSISGDPELIFTGITPQNPAYRYLSLAIETNQTDLKVWAALESPLVKPASGARVPAWNGHKGLGIRRRGGSEIQPLSDSMALLFEAGQVDPLIVLPIEVILNTDFLDPAGRYLGNLVFSVASG